MVSSGPTSQRRTWRRTLLTGAVGLALIPMSVGTVVAQDASPVATDIPAAMTPAMTLEPGTLTTQRPYLIADDPNMTKITPIITAGEMVGDYQMAGTPDGMGVYKDGEDVVLFSNHEWVPKVEGSDEGNLSAGRISRLVLDPETGAVVSGTYALNGEEGWWDLCSATLLFPGNGFENPVFVSGEETTDGPMGGLAFGVDGATGAITPMPWLGYLAHENQIAVPGFGDKKVMFITDDDSEASEVYLYVADSEADLMAGNGQLHVFKADEGANTADIAKGKDLTGSFVPVDQADNTDAAALQSAVDTAGAFKFVRAEDADYDRNTPNVIYFADTGDDEAPNLAADGAPYTTNGRVYKMTLDPADPTKVTNLSVMLDGDTGDDIRNPDNIATNGKSVLILEDLNGYNHSTNPEGVGRVLAFDIASGELTPIAYLDQSDGDGLVNEGDEAGTWEASGAVDASEIYGPGSWLINVQAHTQTTEQFGGVDEGGQILLLQQQ